MQQTQAYYNEFDPFAAEWLRNLIKAGVIAPGLVDQRSIEDVTPNDLSGFTQCHFFAGIGVWSHSLRNAGWSDNRPVWTASCPCQPFSTAGQKTGFDDERHLWPSLLHLIQQCNPDVVFGEQVEASIKHNWLDLVQDDLEGSGYAFGSAGLPAASVGAPHIRQRLYFVGHKLENALSVGRSGRSDGDTGRDGGTLQAEGRSSLSELADSLDSGPQGWLRRGQDAERQVEHGHLGRGGSVSELADAELHGHDRATLGGSLSPSEAEGRVLEPEGCGSPDRLATEGATRGFWRDADWLYCKDQKWRPVESGTFPLAHGITNKMGRLRGYGNAIVPQVAQSFIEAYNSIITTTNEVIHYE